MLSLSRLQKALLLAFTAVWFSLVVENRTLCSILTHNNHFLLSQGTKEAVNNIMQSTDSEPVSETYILRETVSTFRGGMDPKSTNPKSIQTHFCPLTCCMGWVSH